MNVDIIDPFDVPAGNRSGLDSSKPKGYAAGYFPVPGPKRSRIGQIPSYHPKVPGKGKRNVGKPNESVGGSESMKSTALVRPGDIEAVDSQDLLSQILNANLDVIHDENEIRERKAWVEDQKKAIRKNYYNKAKATYDKLWSACASSKVGHDFIQIEIRGTNVKECKVCTYHDSAYKRDPSYNNGGSTYVTGKKAAESVNDDMIQMLSDRMISLDLDAGILVWPTEEEAPLQKPISPKQPIIKWRKK
jgi:hypothetical protein